MTFFKSKVYSLSDLVTKLSKLLWSNIVSAGGVGGAVEARRVVGAVEARGVVATVEAGWVVGTLEAGEVGCGGSGL